MGELSPTQEIITIDTGDGVSKVKTSYIEPLNIYGENFDLLKKEIPEYTHPVSEISGLIRQMMFTRQKYGAVGLAANQCGYAVRLFVIGSEDYNLVCINPKVINQSEKMVKAKEGCLSFPGLFFNVPRPDWVEVEFIDENGEHSQITIHGVTARCFLHELDHLNGIRFIDKVGSMTLRMGRDKQKKLMKKVMKK